jgi:hypothetical protein
LVFCLAFTRSARYPILFLVRRSLAIWLIYTVSCIALIWSTFPAELPDDVSFVWFQRATARDCCGNVASNPSGEKSLDTSE